MTELPPDTTTEPATAVHEYFGDARIAFNREASKHSELCHYMMQLGASTEAEIIGAAASYLKCELSNAYTPEDMTNLYIQFTARLVQLRKEESAAQHVMCEKATKLFGAKPDPIKEES